MGECKCSPFVGYGERESIDMVSKGVQRGVTSEIGAKVLGSLREVKKGGSSLRCVEGSA